MVVWWELGVTSEVASGGYYVVKEVLMWNLTTQCAAMSLLFCSLYVLWILGLCRVRASMLWLPPLVTSVLAFPQGGQDSSPGS